MVQSDNLLSVKWDMYLKGLLIDPERRSCITSISLSEIVKGADMLTFNVSDPDYLFLDDDIFVRDVPIHFEMWILGSSYMYVFDGHISAIDPDFPEEGIPTLAITCMDESYKMNADKKSVTWSNKTSADVIMEKAKAYGFGCVIEYGYDFTLEETITQSDKTDIEFCEELADSEREPFMCKLRNGVLYYVKKGLLSNPVSVLCYKRSPFDVVSFAPQITKETIKVEATAADIKSGTKEIESATVSRYNIAASALVQGDAIVSASAGGRYKYNSDTGTWDFVS